MSTLKKKLERPEQALGSGVSVVVVLVPGRSAVVSFIAPNGTERHSCLPLTVQEVAEDARSFVIPGA